MKFTELRREILSDGSILRLSKAGRTYTVLRSVPMLSVEPEVTIGLNKSKADDLFAEYLRADVMELV